MKNVLITGAMTDIGKATAKVFLEEGFTTILADNNENKELEEALKEKYKDKVYFYLGDMSKNDTIMLLFDYVLDKTQGIEILINCTSAIEDNFLHQFEEKNLDTIFNQTVKPIFLTSKFFLPDIIKKGGGIVVNVTPPATTAIDYKRPAYNAAKGAVINLTRSMSLDYAEFNIRVNSVSPGILNTSLIEEDLRIFNEIKTMHNIPKADDIANAIYFLSTDKSHAINGINIPVTGGIEALNCVAKR